MAVPCLGVLVRVGSRAAGQVGRAARHLLALTLVFVLATAYGGDDASSLMAMAAACGYISLAISLMRQVDAYERVNILEREYRSRTAANALYSGTTYEVSHERG